MNADDELRLAKLLFQHRVSDSCADTAGDIARLCEDAARKIIAAGFRREGGAA